MSTGLLVKLRVSMVYTICVCVEMQAVSLIRFLLKPKLGRIHSINSPFQQEENISLRVAKSWVNRGKADIIDGVLVFRDDFRIQVINQFRREDLKKRASERFEAFVDAERSKGLRTDPSIVTWAAKHSGRSAMAGAPQERTMQVVLRSWPATPEGDE